MMPRIEIELRKMRRANTPIWRLIFTRYGEVPGVSGGQSQCVDIRRPTKEEKALMEKVANGR